MRTFKHTYGEGTA